MKHKPDDKILFVDDEENILRMLRRTLGRDFNLFLARSAEEGLKLIDDHPDFAVIVSDYNMPDTNGIEFLKAAHARSPDSVQVMLTGNIELEVAIQTINETEIFRYLPKPCPIEVVRKVIDDALTQYRLTRDKQRLTQELADSHARLAKKRHLLEYELDMAKAIYSKVAIYGENEPDGVDYFNAAQETVGGDFLLTHLSPDRRDYYIMISDFTGHGLQSALAVLLVTEVFDVLCRDKPSIESLAQNINDKMHRKLPTGLFCAALLVHLELDTRLLHVWQGGMPDAYLLDADGEVLQTLSSNNLPLGVLEDQDFSDCVSHHGIDQANSLFVYSDGITEQPDDNQQMFGEQRLREALRRTPADRRRVEFVIEQLRRHQQQQPQSDDISVFELNLPRICRALEQP